MDSARLDALRATRDNLISLKDRIDDAIMEIDEQLNPLSYEEDRFE